MSGNKVLFDERIKPKNVLALNEKVAAIRCYGLQPVYKQIGKMFNCSPDQIKRIIKQKEEILAEWENRTKRSPPPTSHEIKTVNLSFLGKAVHEWIRRIMYYTDFNLNDTLIQTMALEFAKVLKLTKFYPTKDWIAHFRATYKLPDANTKTMTIGYQESQSVQILDILRYVRQVCEPKHVEDAKPDINASEVGDSKSMIEHETEVEEIKTETVEVKIEDDDNCQPSCSAMTVLGDGSEMSEEVPNDTSDYMINHEIFSPMGAQKHVKIERRPDPEAEPEPNPELEKVVIYTHEGAISCVKLLEEFALLKENFRLIGLIERLEEALNDKALASKKS